MANCSAFTFAHLDSLQRYSVSSPLRAIAHVDLDAFYAQCETVRLGLDPDVPLACQQWQGLIAINYAARKFDIKRHETVTEAKKKCPDLVLAHVATWKQGDTEYKYHEDPDVATHKVSLDQYRHESERIFRIFYDSCDKVEHAGIDEGFLDLSRMLYSCVLDTYPTIHALLELKRETGRLSDHMPLPELKAGDLNWKGNLFPQSSDDQTVDDDSDKERQVDWDEVLLMHASHIVADVRGKVLQDLKYTCSAGISTNKFLAKLCSGYRKPNQQTVLRESKVAQFLSELSFSKIRGLGGKLGDSIAKTFNVPEENSVPFLLTIPKSDLVHALDLETGSWFYDIIRGRDYSEVNSDRVEAKSMMSAKNFRPSINTTEQGVQWIQTFVADISFRVAEAVRNTSNLRLPKTVVIHTRHANNLSFSKQMPIPPCTLESLSQTLYNTGVALYKQIEKEKAKSMYPLRHMSFVVNGFDLSVAKNQAIDAFLVRSSSPDRNKKRTRTTTNEGQNIVEVPPKKHRGGIMSFITSSNKPQAPHSEPTPRSRSRSPSATPLHSPPPVQNAEEDEGDTFVCEVCNSRINIAEVVEHHDWHYADNLARQLQQEESTGDGGTQSTERGNSKHQQQQRKKKTVKLEKGQRKLFSK
ncbi:sister chromatid cohesion protein Eso1 [Myxozyma melibiosi]|uniref:DNA polymerase eta n=1 Tax=Myxozyma melibiosi TaxID=54550 RepID=A0ABR1F0K7_9ASCO